MLKNMMGLPPGTTTTSSGRDLDVAAGGDFIGNGLPQLGQARRRPVMRVAVMQGVAGRFDDVRRSVEIGLADFQVNNVSALLFQGARLYQNFKGGFRAQARHAARQAKFCLGCWSHIMHTRIYRIAA